MPIGFEFGKFEDLIDRAARQIWNSRTLPKGHLQAVLLSETLDDLDRETSAFFQWLQTSDDAQNLKTADRAHLWMRGKICESKDSEDWRKKQVGVSKFRFAGKEFQGDPGVLIPLLKGLRDFCTFHIVHNSITKEDGTIVQMPGAKVPFPIGRWTQLREDFSRWHRLILDRARNVRAVFNEVVKSIQEAGVDPTQVPENVQWKVLLEARHPVESGSSLVLDKHVLDELVLLLSFCMLSEVEFRKHHSLKAFNDVSHRITRVVESESPDKSDRDLFLLLMSEDLLSDHILQRLPK